MGVRAWPAHLLTYSCLLQAVQLQPDNLKALYRLGSAQYHLQHFQQCVETCKAALLIKPNARQLQTVLHQAEDILRLGFLTNRFPEVTKAISKMTVVAAQSVRPKSIACLDYVDESQLASASKHYKKARLTWKLKRNFVPLLVESGHLWSLFLGICLQLAKIKRSLWSLVSYFLLVYAGRTQPSPTDCTRATPATHSIISAGQETD